MTDLAATAKPDDGDDLSPAFSDANGSIAARIVSDFDRSGFRIVLAHDRSLVIRDLWGQGRRHPRALPPQLLTDFSEHADAIGRWLEEGGTI
jgi:hypothetical protein